MMSSNISKKCLLHCGSSKNGSTALQSFLLKNFKQLIEHGIFPLINYYCGDVEVTNRNSIYDIDRIIIHSDPLTDPNKFSNATASFAIPYEAYKQCIFERDSVSLNHLLSKIKTAIDHVFSYIDIHTVIITAEAFETSLCLKDPIFKKILKILAKEYNVEVVYYKPDPVRHAISSWLEWGWIECYKYDEWIAAHSIMTDRSEFFNHRANGVRYFSNLLNSITWTDYWRPERNITYSLDCVSSDIVDHFMKVILNIDYKSLDFYCSLSQSERNVGWLKSLITIFPFFFECFCQEYIKFDIVRSLLRDKESFLECDFSSYNKIVRLTSIIFEEIFSRDFDKNDESKKRIDSALADIRCIFENVDQSILLRVIKYLCETIYYYHQNHFPPDLDR